MVVAMIENTSFHYLRQYTKERDRTVVTYQCWIVLFVDRRHVGEFPFSGHYTKRERLVEQFTQRRGDLIGKFF